MKKTNLYNCMSPQAGYFPVAYSMERIGWIQLDGGKFIWRIHQSLIKRAQDLSHTIRYFTHKKFFFSGPDRI